MALVLSDDRWLRDEGRPASLLARGKAATVKVTTIGAESASKPAFVNYETVGYVADGTVEAFLVDLADRPRGQVLGAGSFFRIPATLIHWFRNRGAVPALLMSALVANDSPPWQGPAEGVALAAEWEDEEEFMKPAPPWQADPSRYPVGEDDEKRALGDPPRSLFRPGNEVKEFGISHHLVVPLRTKVVCGVGASIMVADRPGTYHSTPHIHAAEQINVVTRGSNWKYCIAPDGRYAAAETKAGDVFRFPTMVPHWAWGRDGSGSGVVEFHVPGLHGDPDFRVGLVSLVSDDADLEPVSTRARNIFLDTSAYPLEEIESGA